MTGEQKSSKYWVSSKLNENLRERLPWGTEGEVGRGLPWGSSGLMGLF